MSENFSKELCACLKKNNVIMSGQSMRNFIKDTGIGIDEFRSFLVGDALPSEDKLSRIITKADLTNADRLKLKSEYYKAKKGSKLSLELANAFSFLGDVNAKNSVKDNDKLVRNHVNGTITATRQGTYALMSSIIKAEIDAHKENGTIKVILNNDIKVIERIKSISLAGEVTSMEIIFCLSAVDSPEAKKRNLECVSAVTHMCLERDKLEIKYFRKKVFMDSRSRGAFPFWILTSESILMISADFSMSFLITDEEQRKICLEEYTKISDASKLLISSFAHEDIFVKVRDFYKDNRSDKLFSLTYAPEMMSFFQRDELPLLISDDIADFNAVLNIMYELWDDFNDPNITTFSLFTKQGLQEFAENGVLYEYDGLLKPLSVSQRSDLLKRMRTVISMERLNPKKYLMRNEKFSISPKFSVFVSEQEIVEINVNGAKVKRHLNLNNSFEFECLVSIFGSEFASNAQIGREIVKPDELISFLDTLIESCGG